MNPCFADTGFFVALLHARDALHAEALRYERRIGGSLFTTEWVLLELGNWTAETRLRISVAPMIASLRQRGATILPATSETFHAGLHLYASRPDKHWSLVDCLSFHVMRTLGLTEALTADHHFEQAGFSALLRA